MKEPKMPIPDDISFELGLDRVSELEIVSEFDSGSVAPDVSTTIESQGILPQGDRQTLDELTELTSLNPSYYSKYKNVAAFVAKKTCSATPTSLAASLVATSSYVATIAAISATKSGMQGATSPAEFLQQAANVVYERSDVSIPAVAGVSALAGLWVGLSKNNSSKQSSKVILASALGALTMGFLGMASVGLAQDLLGHDFESVEESLKNVAIIGVAIGGIAGSALTKKTFSSAPKALAAGTVVATSCSAIVATVSAIKAGLEGEGAAETLLQRTGDDISDYAVDFLPFVAGISAVAGLFRGCSLNENNNNKRCNHILLGSAIGALAAGALGVAAVVAAKELGEQNFESYAESMKAAAKIGATAGSVSGSALGAWTGRQNNTEELPLHQALS